MKKLREKMFVGVIICCIFAAPFYAQETSAKKLTVEEAVELALQNNIEIKQSKLDLDLLEKKKKNSWNSASPSLSLSGGLSGRSRDLTKDYDEVRNRDSLSWSVSGGISITLAPALATSIKSAKLAYENGEASYEATQKKIEMNVIKTFYSLVYFNENLELQERALLMAKQTFDSNKTKYEQGRLSELILLNSQYAYESKIPNVENLKNTYQNNIDNFKLVLGLGLIEEIELDGDLDDFVHTQLDDSILEQNIDEIPAIKSLIRNIQSAEIGLSSVKYSTYAPSMSFSVSVPSGAGINPSSDPNLSLTYSANIKIPLDGYMPWTSTSINIESQKENIEKLKLTLEQTKNATAIQIRNSYNSIVQAQKQLELLEKNVDLMLKTYDMTHHAYDVGSTDLLSLQTAENNLYTARYNVQNQRYSIISQILDLENTLGISLRSK